MHQKSLQLFLVAGCFSHDMSKTWCSLWFRSYWSISHWWQASFGWACLWPTWLPPWARWSEHHAYVDLHTGCCWTFPGTAAFIDVASRWKTSGEDQAVHCPKQNVMIFLHLLKLGPSSAAPIIANGSWQWNLFDATNIGILAKTLNLEIDSTWFNHQAKISILIYRTIGATQLRLSYIHTCRCNAFEKYPVIYQIFVQFLTGILYIRVGGFADFLSPPKWSFPEKYLSFSPWESLPLPGQPDLGTWRLRGRPLHRTAVSSSRQFHSWAWMTDDSGSISGLHSVYPTLYVM